MGTILDLYQDTIYVSGSMNASGARADEAKREVDVLRLEIQDLQRKSDALTIAFHALWEIVQERGGIAHDAILKKMEEIDARSPQGDDKPAAVMAACPQCGRRTNVGRKCCLYCGKLLPVTSVLGKI